MQKQTTDYVQEEKLKRKTIFKRNNRIIKGIRRKVDTYVTKMSWKTLKESEIKCTEVIGGKSLTKGHRDNKQVTREKRR